jgi:hypothetical protein
MEVENETSSRPAGLPCKECEQATRAQIAAAIVTGAALGAAVFWIFLRKNV